MRRAVAGIPWIFLNSRSGVLALVDAAARAHVNDVGVIGIDDDGEHVGVVDDSLLDVVPVGASVGRLPGQMPGAGIHDVGIFWINRQRFHLVDFFAAWRTDELPRGTSVRRTKHALQRPRKEHVRVGRGQGKGTNRLPMKSRCLLPGFSPIVADPKAPVGPIELPCRSIDFSGIARIHKNVVNHKIVGGVEPGKPAPVSPFVRRFVDQARGGSQVKVIRLARYRRQRTRVAPVGTHRRPCNLRRSPQAMRCT